MLRTFLAISVLAMSCLSNASLELCAHEGGEVHLFLFGDSCAGEHAEHHSNGDGHEDGHSSGHEHQHKGHSHQGEAEHHEPCDHEFLDFEGEWLARAAHSVLIEISQPVTLACAEIPQFAVPQWVKISAEYPPRAPPWRGASGDHFLATIRLLV